MRRPRAIYPQVVSGDEFTDAMRGVVGSGADAKKGVLVFIGEAGSVRDLAGHAVEVSRGFRETPTMEPAGPHGSGSGSPPRRAGPPVRPPT